MTTEVGKLLVKIEADTGQLRKSLNRVQQTTERTVGKLKNLGLQLGA